MNLTRSTLPFVLSFAASLALAHTDKDHGASAPGASHHHSHADAIGVPGKAAKVNRTVNVDMTDAMRFSPASIAVKQGETVRFVIKNSGQLKHEFVLGTEKELKDHYELMKKFPQMEHSDPNQVTVAAGKTGEVIWQFTRAGKVDFACLQPGHYDAGMKGMVNVTAASVVSFAQASAPTSSGTQARLACASFAWSCTAIRTSTTCARCRSCAKPSARPSVRISTPAT